MDDQQVLQDAFALKEAAGAIELAEGLLAADAPPPAAVRRLLEKVVERLDRLGDAAASSVFARLLRGEALRALGRWPEAIEALNRVVERDPSVVAAWVGLGWCHKRTGHLDAAITCLRQGLEAAPDEPLLHYNLACYLSLSGDAAAAVDHLSRAITRESHYRTLMARESDFDPIRADPRFIAATKLSV